MQKFLEYDVLKELEKSKCVCLHTMQVPNTAGVQEVCESRGRIQGQVPGGFWGEFLGTPAAIIRYL